jgi:hypothetical protein
MTPTEFKRSLSQTRPPAGLTSALAGLWWAGKKNWNRAHKLVMDEGGKDCAWVHAHLHRLEGDRENAHYWYKRAGQSEASGSLPAEWAAIVAHLLTKQGKPAR